MILQQPLERGPQGLAQRHPQAALGSSRGLDARWSRHLWFPSVGLTSQYPSLPFSPCLPRDPLCKHFLSEENMATHFSQLSLHNDHPYCSPPRAFPPALPPLRGSCSELLLWRYPGNLIPEALRLLRLGDTPTPLYLATPAGDIVEL
ncbi:host cell factor C1 regulator 1 isoform X3 [Carlito syrichta]|uniref:Host cell factor C1 regulator 1 isoform X3 n=1 Tax=Carlito syrichta TaxID=1868482 RepID=A0A3Q0DJ64_CARSF|nr:host cell factor C1 regulator 1 isoform X3 [Carlito syrichta]